MSVGTCIHTGASIHRVSLIEHLVPPTVSQVLLFVGYLSLRGTIASTTCV